MRILIITTDYEPFLESLYAASPGLSLAPHAAQGRERNASLFGVSDFYSASFEKQGHVAVEVYANNWFMQFAWAHEHGLLPRWRQKSAPTLEKIIDFGRMVRNKIMRIAPPLRRLLPIPRPLLKYAGIDLAEILLEQVKDYRPDVILNQAVSEVSNALVHRMRPYARVIVGQIASPLPDDAYDAYDLMVSSLPNFVTYFQNKGVPASLNRLAFGARALDSVGTKPRDIPVSFVGSVTPSHESRFRLLEALAAAGDVLIWGRVDGVPKASPIWRQYQGPAWGADMYNVLARSKITVNQHIDIAENFANNMRLYEATGMGAMLLTDWKDNIADMFEPGREVACYRSAEDCQALIRYYLSHEDERARVAKAGQARTLRDHTYGHRTAELALLFESAKKTPHSAARENSVGV